MDNEWLVPANTKKSTLVLGFLRPLPDCLILGTGLGITVVMFLLLDIDKIFFSILSIIPLFIVLLLVLPIPNYHNTLELIKSIMNFYFNRRNYVWKGWCNRDEFKD